MEDLDIELVSMAGHGVVVLNGDDVSELIRKPEISRVVGSFADKSIVRNFLVQRQRAIGKSGKIVAEGRDMASIVFRRVMKKGKIIMETKLLNQLNLHLEK